MEDEFLKARFEHNSTIFTKCWTLEVEVDACLSHVVIEDLLLEDILWKVL